MGVYQIYPKKRKSFLPKLSVTVSLILINVVLFLIVFPLWVSGAINENLFAIKPSNILQGKYLWTFLTSMFMHGGFFIFCKYVFLMFIGSLVERILGAKRYLYFI